MATLQEVNKAVTTSIKSGRIFTKIYIFYLRSATVLKRSKFGFHSKATNSSAFYDGFANFAFVQPSLLSIISLLDKMTQRTLIFYQSPYVNGLNAFTANIVDLSERPLEMVQRTVLSAINIHRLTHKVRFLGRRFQHKSYKGSEQEEMVWISRKTNFERNKSSGWCWC